MHKWLKRSGFALVTLALIAIVEVPFYPEFRSKVYQERLVQEVKLRYERDLEIKGMLSSPFSTYWFTCNRR